MSYARTPLPPVPLIPNDFTTVQSDDEFIDWERYPNGYGTDGKARTERLTYCHSNSQWYASIDHVDPDNTNAYIVNSGYLPSMQDAIAFLDADRKRIDQAHALSATLRVASDALLNFNPRLVPPRTQQWTTFHDAVVNRIAHDLATLAPLATLKE